MTQPSSPRLRPFKPIRFGRYVLLSPLATGGMGEVFLARFEGAKGFEKTCVIKKILPHLAAEPDFVERFVAEARVLVKLSHGNIAQVLDMGLEEGAPYIALEFIDGKDTRKLLGRMRDRQEQVPLSLTLYIIAKVLDALAYAHRKRGDDEKELGLVHRDISPQNVLVSYEGEVKIIDFGLAKSALSTIKTNPSILLGKFLYMSPEQARHQRVDRRSDLYAVGLLMYELVAGHNPFDAGGTADLISRVQNPQIPSLKSVEPRCSMALNELVMKALSPDPAARFQSAEELRGKVLAQLVELDASAGPESASEVMREVFAADYAHERKLLGQLREGGAPNSSRSETRESSRAETKESSRAETLEAASAGSEPDSGPRRSVSARRRRLADEPSVVVEGSDQPTVEPAPAPATVPMRRAKDPATVRRARPQRSAATTDEDAGTDVPGVNTDPEPERGRSTTLMPQQRTPLWVWLVLPSMALAAAASWLVWDRYAETARQKQLEAERRALLGDESKPERRREVVVDPQGPPASEPADGTTEDALAGVPVEPPPRRPGLQPVRVPVAVPALTPAQQALARVRKLHTELGALNAGAAAKYRLRIGHLSDQVSTNAESGDVAGRARGLAQELETAIERERME